MTTPRAAEPATTRSTSRARRSGSTTWPTAPTSSTAATGFDTASYAGRTLPVALSLDGLRNDGQAGELDSLLAFEAIVGGYANDALQGGTGDDTLTPGPGDDTVAGGAGEDAVDYSDRTQPVTVTLGAAGLGGVAGERDTIAADVEDATGGAGNDTLIGTNATTTSPPAAATTS